MLATVLQVLGLLGLMAGCSAVDKEGAVPFSPPLLQSADPANVNEIQSVQLPFTDTAAFPIDNFAGYAFSTGGGTIEVELNTGSGARQAFALYGPRATNGVWGNAILQRDGREPTLTASLSVDSGRYLLLVGTVSGTESGQYTVSASCSGPSCQPLQTTCGELDCINDCPLGYVTDAEGCQTCQCITECTSEFDCPGDEVCTADGECVAGCQCNQPLDPVCGADGQTYGNECEASCAGVEVVAFQACAEECPALPCDLDCPDGLATDSQGCPICECRSECDNCSSRFEPVCTANGRTYINRCEAECAGEAVNYLGQCRTECANLDCDLTCPDGLALDGNGCPQCACGPEPLSCESSPDGVEMAVCAANGATYPSTCEADAVGAAVVYDEFCPGYVCRTDTSCPLGTTCLKPDGGANCLMNSAGECLGVCIRQQSCDPVNGMFAGCPEGYLCIDGQCESSCSCSSVYDPVCGNDNITYDNACVASCAGARIVKAGRCCQPLDGCMLDCPNGYQLDGNQCATCQCRAEPPCACTDLDSPVCVTTADGQALTYQNECWAQCDGYSDIADGSCP